MRIIVEPNRGLIHISIDASATSFERGIFIPASDVEGSAAGEGSERERDHSDLRLFVPPLFVFQVAFFLRALSWMSLKLKIAAQRWGRNSHPRVHVCARVTLFLACMSAGWGWAKVSYSGEHTKLPSVETEGTPSSALAAVHARFQDKPTFQEVDGHVSLTPTRLDTPAKQTLFLLPAPSSESGQEFRWIFSSAVAVVALVEGKNHPHSMRAAAALPGCDGGGRWWLIPQGATAVSARETEDGEPSHSWFERTTNTFAPGCPQPASAPVIP